MALRHLIFGTALFAAGVLTSDRVTYAIASHRAAEPLPHVRVSYEPTGTYVNGERVDPSTGRIGEPRCEWRALKPAQRAAYALDELTNDEAFSATYLARLRTEDQVNLVYRALVQLARKAGSSIGEETDRLRDAVGFRWDLQYKQPGENPFPVIEEPRP